MIVVIVSCQGKSNEKKETPLPDENLTTLTYEVAIEGMTCTGCEETIEGGIMKIDGVRSVEASHTDGMALVVFYSEKTDTTAIKESIVRSGYTVTGFKPGATE